MADVLRQKVKAVGRFGTDAVLLGCIETNISIYGSLFTLRCFVQMLGSTLTYYKWYTNNFVYYSDKSAQKH